MPPCATHQSLSKRGSSWCPVSFSGREEAVEEEPEQAGSRGQAWDGDLISIASKKHSQGKMQEKFYSVKEVAKSGAMRSKIGGSRQAHFEKVAQGRRNEAMLANRALQRRTLRSKSLGIASGHPANVNPVLFFDGDSLRVLRVADGIIRSTVDRQRACWPSLGLSPAAQKHQLDASTSTSSFPASLQCADLTPSPSSSGNPATAPAFC